LPHPLLWMPVSFGTTNAATTPSSSSGASSPTYAASRDLVRLGQLNTNQYNSTQEYNTWAYSACSAAAMTEVINAYGHKYRITDILTIEAKIHEITPQEGLLEDVGIQHTGTQFGFKTTWGYSLSLDQVIATANRGTPVIVSFPPSKYAGGHLLVVRGGTSSLVYLADSSLWNRTQLTHAAFLQWWGGFSAIMTPK
jgi:predicted double-glycine peptidase